MAKSVQAEAPDPTPEAVRLLTIAEDAGRGYDDRVAALRDLGRLGDRGAVARLLKLITLANDVVTLNAIYAVGGIGDPRALPRLRELAALSLNREGEINGAFISVIEKLEKPVEPAAAPESAQAHDAGVLEAVLIDLLTQADSPVELDKEANKEIHFSKEALRSEIKPEDVLLIRDGKKLEKLSQDHLSKVREAVDHLAQRVAKKDLFKEFAPKDKRIIVYSRDAAAKDKDAPHLGGTQVFRAYSPGYSKDQEVAVVRLFFTWSGGFHGATATYLLQKRKGGWTVLLKDVVSFL